MQCIMDTTDVSTISFQDRLFLLKQAQAARTTEYDSHSRDGDMCHNRPCFVCVMPRGEITKVR